MKLLKFYGIIAIISVVGGIGFAHMRHPSKEQVAYNKRISECISKNENAMAFRIAFELRHENIKVSDGQVLQITKDWCKKNLLK